MWMVRLPSAPITSCTLASCNRTAAAYTLRTRRSVRCRCGATGLGIMLQRLCPGRRHDRLTAQVGANLRMVERLVRRRQP